MALVLADAEEGSLLRAWHQAEDLGKQLRGGFLRICDLGKKGTESKQVGPVIVQVGPGDIAGVRHLSGTRWLRCSEVHTGFWRFPALLHRISSPTRMKRSEAASSSLAR